MKVFINPGLLEVEENGLVFNELEDVWLLVEKKKKAPSVLRADEASHF